MDEKLIRKYLEYASSEEAYAVLFVRKHLKASEGKWVDIVEVEESRYFDEMQLEFKAVLCELFDRKIKPTYPKRSEIKDEHQYILACRAVTWDASHRDIEQQRRKGTEGPRYLIRGIKYNENRGKSYFIDNAPPEIKALEKNINDRTDPLWAQALSYARPAKWVYKIKSIKRTTARWIE